MERSKTLSMAAPATCGRGELAQKYISQSSGSCQSRAELQKTHSDIHKHDTIFKNFRCINFILCV